MPHIGHDCASQIAQHLHAHGLGRRPLRLCRSDSKTRLNWERVETSYTRLFKDFVKAGVLAASDDCHHNIYNRDWAFTAPSAAVAMVAGRNANGRPHWTVQGTNTTHGEWQDEQVTRATAQVSGLDTPGASAIAVVGG